MHSHNDQSVAESVTFVLVSRITNHIIWRTTTLPSTAPKQTENFLSLVVHHTLSLFLSRKQYKMRRTIGLMTLNKPTYNSLLTTLKA